MGKSKKNRNKDKRNSYYEDYSNSQWASKSKKKEKRKTNRDSDREFVDWDSL